MRLLIVSQYFWPENFRVNELVAQMRQRGHEVTVLTGLPCYPEGRVFSDFSRAPERFARYEGADIVRVPLVPRGSGRFRLLLNYVSFVLAGTTLGARRLKGRSFDAIFVFEPSPITACLPAIAIGGMKSIPVALWVLDLWPETLSAVGVVRSPRLLGLIGRLVSFIYRHCDLVLAQSHAFMSSIRQYAGPATTIRYFPGWAEGIFLSPEARVAQVAPELAPYRGSFNVLFAGNVGEAQDFPAILDAAAALRHRTDIRWLIVGDGRAAAWVKAEISRRELTSTVAMLGRYPIERMPSFFAGASALLVALKRDPVFAMTVPAKVQSYLAAGLPLIGMLDGEGARIIEESGAGWVCPAGDSDALAALVERVAALDADERGRVAARGLEYVRREFDRDRLLSELEMWLRDLARARVEVA